MNILAEVNGNVSAGARSAGIPYATFQKIVDDAKQQGYISNLPKPKPRIRVPARSVYEPQPNTFGKAVRVLVWGCAHDSPNIPDGVTRVLVYRYVDPSGDTLAIQYGFEVNGCLLPPSDWPIDLLSPVGVRLSGAYRYGVFA